MNKRQEELEKRIKEPLTQQEQEILESHKIPSYMEDVYNWAYVNPKNIDRLDKPYVYHTILFGQGWKLMRAYLNEINHGSNMLQTTHVYGNLLNKVIDKIGSKGSLDVTDVIPYQVEKAKRKIAHHKNVNFWVQNAADPYHKKYDIIGVYFLLHEIPDDLKTRVIDNALKIIEETNGKLVFIDYHNPSFFNPIRPILRLVNTFLEPFANSIWDREIKHFASQADKFNWKKTTYFMKAYQKVVVTKKNSDEKDNALIKDIIEKNKI